jgi:hypothetical protein
MIQYKKGDKIGKLTFINEDFHQKEITGFQSYRMVVMECFCKRRFITRLSAVRYGKVNSCGCTRKNGLLKRITRHNMSNSSEYSSWESMKSRCLNSNNMFYCNYGGRGIKVCERWMDFKNFYEDMKNKPNSNYSLDRINVDGNYEPDNCRWVTKDIQDRNKRNSVYLFYNNKKYILSDLAKKFNLNQQTLKSRLNKGMSLEKALTKPYKYTKKL